MVCFPDWVEIQIMGFDEISVQFLITQNRLIRKCKLCTHKYTSKFHLKKLTNAKDMGLEPGSFVFKMSCFQSELRIDSPYWKNLRKYRKSSRLERWLPRADLIQKKCHLPGPGTQLRKHSILTFEIISWDLTISHSL